MKYGQDYQFLNDNIQKHISYFMANRNSIKIKFSVQYTTKHSYTRWQKSTSSSTWPHKNYYCHTIYHSITIHTSVCGTFLLILLSSSGLGEIFGIRGPDLSVLLENKSVCVCFNVFSIVSINQTLNEVVDIDQLFQIHLQLLFK